MLGRFAWIACFGLTLLCFADIAPESALSLNAELNSVTQASEFNAVLAGLDQWLEDARFDLDSSASLVPLVRFANSEFRGPRSLRQSNPEPIDVGINGHSKLPPSSESSFIQLVTFTSDNEDSDLAGKTETSYWPKPKTLLKQVEALQQVPAAELWSTETLMLLDSISQTPPGSAELDRFLDRLEVQVQQLPEIAAAIQSDNSDAAIWQRSEISRAAYRLDRRLAVWRKLRVSNEKLDSSEETSSVSNTALSRISFEQLDPRWVKYLRLEDYRDAFEPSNPDAGEQKKIARSILSRVYSPVLKPQQAAFVQQVIDPEIIQFLKQHASDPLDTNDLLKRIEQYETRCSCLAGYYLNNQYQNLLWSEDPGHQAIANEIQTHYRNANFRLSVSSQLLNRMIPELPTTAVPVSERIHGAQVSGKSRVSNQLRVELIPDPNQIMIQLATRGQVHSDTVARTSSFRIQNQGQAQFQVVKPVAIGRDGIDSSGRAHSSSSANQYVVGVESNLDDVPVLGWMARRLAEKRIREKAPESNRIFRQKVVTSAESQIQQQLDKQIAKLRNYCYTNLFQPLLAMDLDPVPMQMATTDRQVVMRYRLAGGDQMAANTSRPRDSGSSLLSIQLHQSAINNAIARLDLNGNQFTIDQLRKHLREVAGAPQLESEAAPSDDEAEIRFAHFDPIRFDFEEDRLNVTLNLISLRVGEGKSWKNISLTASYKLNVSGMKLNLEQDDDGTRIKGRRLGFGDKAGISTVMKVMFKKEYAFHALPRKFNDRIGGDSLEVSQLVVSDGWLAVSIDDIPQQAKNQSPRDENQRFGAIRRLMDTQRR